MVSNMDESEYFTQIGYELALGKDKVGWMAISAYDIIKYSTMTEEQIREDVEQWTLTGQWAYQVANAIAIWLKPMLLDDEARLEKFDELQEYVIDGFIKAIYMLISE